MYELRAVLLDFDNTLAYSFETYFLSLNRALKMSGLPELSRRDFIDLYRKSESNVPLSVALSQLLEGKGVRLSDRLFEEVIERYREAFIEVDGHLTFIPPLNTAALAALASRFKVAIVTARPSRESVLRVLRRFDVEGYVQCIVAGQDASSAKPSGEPLLLAASRLSVEPQECVVIGDSPRDVEAGRRAGMRVIGVASGVWSREELVAAGAMSVVESLPEAVNLVLSLSRAGQ